VANNFTLSTAYQAVRFLPANIKIPSAGAASKYTAAFTGTTVTITDATHGLGSADLIVQVFDNATPRALVIPGSVTIHPSTFAVVITMAESATYNVVLF
jgi:hypothetical protein